MATDQKLAAMKHRHLQEKSEIQPLLQMKEWSPQLVALLAFMLVVFFTGGSSRYDVPHLMVLRPLAICMIGFALTSFTAENWLARKPIWLLTAAVLALTILHLIPLPPQIWRELPGRDIIVDIDALAGLQGVWRPLTMFPEGTWNALYALSVPVAVLLLASQLSERDLLRLLLGMLILSSISGMVGAFQAAGSSFRLYRLDGGISGLFGNRNHQAALLACLFPMLAALSMCAPHFSRHPRVIRIILGSGATTLVPLLIVTGSRMGLLVAVLAFLFSGIVSIRQRGVKGSGAYSSLIFLAVATLIAAGLLLLATYASRDLALDRLEKGSSEDLRWPVWEQIIRFLPDYLPWGSGIGSFVPVYQIHEADHMLLPQYVNQAHNDWLDIALTSGAPGIALCAVAILMFARATGSALVAQGIAGHLRRAGIGVILVLAFASLSDYPVRTPILSALLAIAAIWASAPIQRKHTHESMTHDAQA